MTDVHVYRPRTPEPTTQNSWKTFLVAIQDSQDELMSKVDNIEWLISDFTLWSVSAGLLGNTISGPVIFGLVSSFVCRCSHLQCPTWAKVIHFAQHAKWPINMAASSHYLPLRYFKPSIQNPFRGCRYVTDLKSLSRGDSPPTTSISWASYSVMPTEAWSERGHRLHLPLPVVRSHERPPGPETRAADCSQPRTEWVGSEREAGEGRRVGGRCEGAHVYLQDILIAVFTSAKCWVTAHGDI